MGNGTKPLDFVACDSRYFWNKNNYQSFLENNVSVKWYTPLICGALGYANTTMAEKVVELTLISRRSTLRAGTRLNARGIDDDGNVGNYVETEQILTVGDNQTSFIITRGSVPIFWTQAGKGNTKLFEDTIIDRSSEMTKTAFTRHFDSMVKDYEQIMVIDLL